LIICIYKYIGEVTLLLEQGPLSRRRTVHYIMHLELCKGFNSVYCYWHTSGGHKNVCKMMAKVYLDLWPSQLKKELLVWNNVTLCTQIITSYKHIGITLQEWCFASDCLQLEQPSLNLQIHTSCYIIQMMFVKSSTNSTHLFSFWWKTLR
jgi:hypothetical protein